MPLKKLHIFIYFLFFAYNIAAADDSVSSKSTSNEDWGLKIPSWLSLHSQYTNVTQYHASFTSPYQSTGANSMTALSSTKSTNDVTLYLGVRLAEGTEAFFNPEIDQGYGLTNTLGMAGFPSGEAYKVGKGNHTIKSLDILFVKHLI